MQKSEPDRKNNVLAIRVTAIAPIHYKKQILSRGKVSNDAPISIIEIGNIIGKYIGKRTRTIRLPLWPFYLAADISTAVFPRLGLKPPIYRRRVDFYTKDRKFNNRKVRELPGYTSKMDNETGLAQTVRWYQKQGLI